MTVHNEQWTVHNEQCIGIKMSDPPARASLVVVFIWKIFSPPRRDLGQSMGVNGEISPKKASPLSI